MITPTALDVLLCIAPAPKHGFAIIRHHELILGRALGPTAMFLAIDELLAAQLIEIISTPAHGDRERTYYQITAKGQGVLKDLPKSAPSLPAINPGLSG